MTEPDLSVARDLGVFIDASPSPFHAVETVTGRLEAAGYQALSEQEAWEIAPGGWYVKRSGTIVAWWIGQQHDAASGWRIVGAHTDSPNLRVKPNPDVASAGVAQVGVEIYGGALRNTWLDRDLGLSGRVAVAGTDGVTTQLVRVDAPTFRVPQLAIHLDKGLNDKGLKLNPQQHMVPVMGMDSGPAFSEWLADVVGAEADAIVGWDLMLHDLVPSGLLGAAEDFFVGPRIDNLASCHAATLAMAALDSPRQVPVMCLFDHEEVGSVSASGAASSILPTLLERLNLALGGDRESLAIALARSICISADGAHATHPNYVDRHEPAHQIALNGGPTIKRNSNERYATNAVGQGAVVEACRAADVPYQHFVTRTDLACGSTIGPVTSARLGITTVDMGMPQLSMHSAREMAGSADPGYFTRALTSFLNA